MSASKRLEAGGSRRVGYQPEPTPIGGQDVETTAARPPVSGVGPLTARGARAGDTAARGDGSPCRERPASTILADNMNDPRDAVGARGSGTGGTSPYAASTFTHRRAAR